MQLAIRRRHRRIFLVMGGVLPILFVAGIFARRSVPDVFDLPPNLSPSSNAFTVTEWARTDLFPKSPIQIRLLRESADAGKCAFAFSAAETFVKPDLIVYWVAGNPAIKNLLPEDACLLGAFSSGSLNLPERMTNKSGVLVLYSLADNEIVDVSKPFQCREN